MIVLFICLGVILLVFLWILLAPLEIIIDTRVPIVLMRLRSISKVSIDFRQDDFWLTIKVFFMRFNWRIQELARKKTVTKSIQVKKQNAGTRAIFPKIMRVLKSTRVSQFELRIKPNDYTTTGMLYPLNFFQLADPYKLSVTFNEEPYLAIRITTVPWRIAYAFIWK